MSDSSVALADPPVITRDPLLAPFQLKGLTIRNRVFSSSHASRLTQGDFPQERYQRYHLEKARGGIGLSMFGGSSNVSADSPNTFQQINIGTDEIVPHLQRFSQRMHAEGAALMCQITHLGRRGNAYADPWMPMIGPSPVRETLHRAIPREMTTRDIERVVKAYGAAARRCKQGGLDGMETLSSGHLIGQFLDPGVNLRTDAYGGSLANRMRFVLAVHEEIRKQVGEDFPVGIRFGVEEGMSFEDSLEIARVLQDSGLIDFFNVVFGRIDTKFALATNSMPSMFMPSAPFLDRAARFKQAVSLPVLHAAKIADLATARYAIREGLLDLVGMTRAHIAEPHLVRLIEAGREEAARPCVGASFCRNTHATCIHNPATGRESQYDHSIEPAAAPRRVVVVGAGVAGLEAARVAALRGHDVTVLEAGNAAGGQVLLAAESEWRRDLIGIVQWRVDALVRAGVTVRYDCYAEPQDILTLDPDVVIMATGGAPNMEQLPGAELAWSVFDALTTSLPREGRVLVYDGTGRHNAYVCVERFARAGLSVELAVLDGAVGQELGGKGDDVAWEKRLHQWRVPVRNHMHLKQIERDASGAKRASFVHELTGETEVLVADHIVIERGLLAVDDVFHALRADSINDGETELDAFVAGRPQSWAAASGREPSDASGFELYRIGDAQASRDIHSAIYDAFRLARVL